MSSFQDSSHNKLLLKNAAADDALSNSTGDRQHLTRQDITTIFVNESEALIELAKKLRLRQIVVATALVYFRRFYSRNSFVDFDPRLVAPTCLWLASKVEECYVVNAPQLVEKLVGKDQQLFTEDDLLKCEFYVLEQLDYQLVVHHCYPLLANFASETNLSLDNLWKIVNDSYLTSVSLHHSPQIIALGCVLICAELKKEEVSEWLEKLDVDHSAIWDVAKSVLELYELWNGSRELTVKLLEKAKPTYTITYLGPKRAVTNVVNASSSATQAANSSFAHAHHQSKRKK